MTQDRGTEIVEEVMGLIILTGMVVLVHTMVVAVAVEFIMSDMGLLVRGVLVVGVQEVITIRLPVAMGLPVLITQEVEEDRARHKEAQELLWLEFHNQDGAESDMSYFAEIDKDGIVIRRLVVEPDVVNSGAFGDPSNWVQYKHNSKTRRPMGNGYKYDKDNGFFIQPQPYPSWSLDSNFRWQPPKPPPDSEKAILWNEEALEWEEPSPLAKGNMLTDGFPY